MPLPLIKKKRNPVADLLKGLAVIFMIQVHIMEQFARPEIYESIIGKISLFLGGPPCAPVFMAVMGYFLASSQKPFSYFLKRGILLFTGGILLNITRSLNLFFHIKHGHNEANPLFYIFGVDILPLAGLAILIIGVLQFVFRRNYIYYFLLAIFIAAISPFLPLFGMGENILSYVNAFFWGNFEWSYFPLFPWFAYILLGFSFNLFTKKYHVLEKFSSSYSLVFSIPVFLIAGFTISYAVGIAHDLQGKYGYYHHNILYFGWIVLFMTGYIMLAHLIEEYSGKQLLTRYIKWVGKNVTVFYVIQWIIIGNIAGAIYQTQNKLYLVYWFLGITVLVSITTFFYEKIKFILFKK